LKPFSTKQSQFDAQNISTVKTKPQFHPLALSEIPQFIYEK